MIIFSPIYHTHFILTDVIYLSDIFFTKVVDVKSYLQHINQPEENKFNKLMNME